MEADTDSTALTDRELGLVSKLGHVHSEFVLICGRDTATASEDMREVTTLVHELQRMVLAQAAARCYPGKFRLLGEQVETSP